MRITTEVEVEVDVEEVLDRLNASEKREIVEELAKTIPLTDEDRLWQQARHAAAAGHIDQLLSIVQTIGWNHHGVFVDASRCARRAAA